MLIFLTGGARSGKSSLAERIARKREEELGSPVCYLATARPGDTEMVERISRHQERRPADWLTIEEPLKPAAAVKNAGLQSGSTIILDCVTLLVSNRLLAQDTTADVDKEENEIENGVELDALQKNIQEELAELLKLAEKKNHLLLAVSNEVGLGVVPPSPLGRKFRDLSGWINQWLAARADQSYLVVAGIVLDLKDLEVNKISLPPGKSMK